MKIVSIAERQIPEYNSIMPAQSKVRVRFPPSPTGFLHVGGLRTALFNFLWARHHKGVFILRIEDTDRSREVPGSTENIIETLKTFKLDFDEGPFKQTDRLNIYKNHVQILLDKGAAYKCYCPAERIDELKKQADEAKIPFKYDKHCLRNPSPPASPSESEAGQPSFVIRQNIPEEGIAAFEDLVHGKVTVQNRLLDDGILIKSDGWPTYNFANVVDDHLMEISHVLRGEEFIPSTPKHVLLYQAFGWTLPQFAHLPLLLDKQRRKLSKRTGDVAVKEYLERGYLPEAILNFIAFLGWNPKTEREIFSLDELIAEFDLGKVNKSGAVFDVEKLNWFNAYYIKQKPIGELLQLLKPYFNTDVSKYPDEFLNKIVQIEQERLKTLTEIGERVNYFFNEPEYDKELLRWKKNTDDELEISLEKVKKIVSEKLKVKSEKIDIEKIFLDEIGEGDKGALLWPLRVALTGLKASPGPFEILSVFLVLPNGKELILARIQKALTSLL